MAKNMKKTYHLCLSGKHEVLFRCREDFIRGINCLCLAAIKTQSSLLAYSFMSNHVHICVRTDCPEKFMTNTIIASMFQDKGLMPSEKMAGMMAAAIISDTVMFKSPTCTDKDVRAAERMARIANVSLDELGKEIFSASLGNRTASDLLHADYKEFHIAGYDFAVAQVTCVDSPKMLERKEEFLQLMREAVAKDKLSMMILMLTDVLKEGTQLIYIGDDEIIQQAFGEIPKENTLFLPGVMSRKKQVIPMLSALWG